MSPLAIVSFHRPWINALSGWEMRVPPLTDYPGLCPPWIMTTSRIYWAAPPVTARRKSRGSEKGKRVNDTCIVAGQKT